MFKFRLCASACGVVMLLAACAGPMTAEKQAAADRAACSGYGFTPGTDRFAECMMQTSERREDSKDIQKRLNESTRLQSIQRNGDTRFPVCGAASPDSHLDPVNNKWYAPNCREQ